MLHASTYVVNTLINDHHWHTCVCIGLVYATYSVVSAYLASETNQTALKDADLTWSSFIRTFPEQLISYLSGKNYQTFLLGSVPSQKAVFLSILPAVAVCPNRCKEIGYTNLSQHKLNTLSASFTTSDLQFLNITTNMHATDFQF